MPAPKEVVYTTNHTVSCEGITSGLGHPKVFLEMGEDNKITCPYCSRTFLMKYDDSSLTQTQTSS